VSNLPGFLGFEKEIAFQGCEERGFWLLSSLRYKAPGVPDVYLIQ